MTTRLLTIGGALAVGLGTLVLNHATVPAVASPPDLVTLTGTLTSADRDWGSDRMFVVPMGTSAIDIDLTCAPGEPESLLDFGVGGPAGLRGWSIGRNDHVHIDALSASFGYLPGTIEAGEWRILIGAPADRDGADTPYRVTVRLSRGGSASRPVLASGPGWFAGDLHVHSGHSDGYRTDDLGRERPVPVQELVAAAAAAPLDFVAITDHNTASHWLDIDRAQRTSGQVLLLHGREITTARGHFNAIGERRFTDFRLGPLRPMRRLLRDVARDGAFVSVNHAWLTSGEWCNGCGWIDRDPDTMQGVAGIEVLNGSTPTQGIDGPGWTFWADQLNRGERVVPVGGSDVHDPVGGRASIGQPATVVWAAALSEEAIVAGLKSGRVFVRAGSGAASSVEVVASADDISVNMGQAIAPGPLTLTAHVKGSAGEQCHWIRRGRVVASVAVPTDDEILTLSVDAGSDDWFSVIVSDGGQPQLISSAVYVRDPE